MSRRIALLLGFGLALLAYALPSAALAEECSLTPRSDCYGIEAVHVGLSTTQAGAHPDLTIGVGVKQDPLSEPNVFGLKDGFAVTRNVRFQTPPGLIGDPNILGVPQQCTVQELLDFKLNGTGCPNGSVIGRSTILANGLEQIFNEPVFMMTPPGGDVVARLGTVAGIYPVFIDLRVRSESDYGLVAEVTDAPAVAKLIQLDTTIWGVPADHSHDTERCTVKEAFEGCTASVPRSPGSRPLPFLTNPTVCGVPLTLGVNAFSWFEDEYDPAKEVKAAFPTISGCDKLPFGPGLSFDSTSHKAQTPTGAVVTIKLPASEGPEVLEPAQMRDITVKLPKGFALNPSAGDGQGTCSDAQVRLGTREPSECPDSAKIADTEFDVPVLEGS